jgi:leucyl aminopeptidase
MRAASQPMQIVVAAKVPARTTRVRFLTTSERSKLPVGIREAEISLQPNSRVLFHPDDTLFVGVGDAEGVNADVIRRAAGTAAMALRKAGRMQVALELDRWPDFAPAAVEGALVGGYRFEDFKQNKSPLIERLTLLVPKADVARVRRAAERAQVIGELTNLSRRIANQPGNVVFPASLAEEALWHSRRFGLRCTVLDEKKLRAGKFGGILAVGKGSARPPRLIVLEHRGGSAKEAPLVLIGKAVTFDSGGISIKPAADMEKMIWDKCGGVSVLCAMLAIARLKLKRNVIGLVPSAENMVSADAYRPGDIVTCYDGKAVEIVNTDAEGRMLLADAIGYARKQLKARAIVDVATLTGACGVALGSAAAGLWSSHDGLRAALLEAGTRAGERMWPMPLYSDYDDQIRSEVALVKNSGGRLGGACTAAAFLKTFAEKTPWAHLDVAYTAQSDKERPWLARGATGYGVSTLVTLAEAHIAI